jgi:hypothetical protein
MEITLTVRLSDEDATAIAKVKHTQPDDVTEIKDYLSGYLEGAVEAAHSQAEQDTDPARHAAGTNTTQAHVPQDTRHAAEPAVIRTRLQRLRELIALQSDPDWAPSYVQEILDQDPDGPDPHCPRFAGLVEESGDSAIVVAETIADLAYEMAACVTSEIPMSAIEMIDLDTQEHRQAYTKATVHFMVAEQPAHRT